MERSGHLGHLRFSCLSSLAEVCCMHSSAAVRQIADILVLA